MLILKATNNNNNAMGESSKNHQTLTKVPEWLLFLIKVIVLILLIFWICHEINLTTGGTKNFGFLYKTYQIY